jgi:hypothetical protein
LSVIDIGFSSKRLPGRLVVGLAPQAIVSLQVENQTRADLDSPSQFVRVILVIFSRAKEKATGGRHHIMADLILAPIPRIQSKHAIRTESVQMIRLHLILTTIIVAILHVLNEPLVDVVSLTPIAYSIFLRYAHPIFGVSIVGITITTKSLYVTLGMLFEPKVHV